MLVVGAGHLSCAVRDHADADLAQLAHGAVMRAVADLLAARRSGVDLKTVSEPSFIYHVLEHRLRHSGAADVAVTDKKHFYHIYDLPRKTLKHLILLGFRATHSIKHMFHIVPYRGLFCPSLGVKLGVKI